MLYDFKCFRDDEEDGEFAAPLVPNPKCEKLSGCGPWTKVILSC
jgi:calnexin